MKRRIYETNGVKRISMDYADWEAEQAAKANHYVAVATGFLGLAVGLVVGFQIF